MCDLHGIGESDADAAGGDTSRAYDTGDRKGDAGYESESELTRFFHVRHRVHDTEPGRWTKRDPLEYVDGPSLSTERPSRSRLQTGHGAIGRRTGRGGSSATQVREPGCGKPGTVADNSIVDELVCDAFGRLKQNRDRTNGGM